MAAEAFPFRVYSGRGLEFQGEAAMVTIKTQVGEIAILPRHCEYVGNLGTGIATFTLKDGSVKRAIISEGFLKFSQGDNLLTVLADAVDRSEEVSDKSTAAEQAELQVKLTTAGATDSAEWEMINQQIERLRAIDTLQKMH